MRFFDVTPSGQILNRFSKDMDEGLKQISYFLVAVFTVYTVYTVF